VPRPIIAEACGIEHKIGGSSALLAVDSCIGKIPFGSSGKRDNFFLLRFVAKRQAMPLPMRHHLPALIEVFDVAEIGRVDLLAANCMAKRRLD
jgi:hypothetical protein